MNICDRCSATDTNNQGLYYLICCKYQHKLCSTCAIHLHYTSEICVNCENTVVLHNPITKFYYDCNKTLEYPQKTDGDIQTKKCFTIPETATI